VKSASLRKVLSGREQRSVKHLLDFRVAGRRRCFREQETGVETDFLHKLVFAGDLVAMEAGCVVRGPAESRRHLANLQRRPAHVEPGVELFDEQAVILEEPILAGFRVGHRFKAKHRADLRMRREIDRDFGFDAGEGVVDARGGVVIGRLHFVAEADGSFHDDPWQHVGRLSVIGRLVFLGVDGGLILLRLPELGLPLACRQCIHFGH
jgi:hypothetical protein